MEDIEAVAPEKMKPMLRFEVSEVKGLSDVELDDEMTLEVKIKIVDLHKMGSTSSVTNVGGEIQEMSLMKRGGF